MLFRLLTLPVTGPWRGFRALVNILIEEAEQQLYDVGAIRQQLESLQARHQRGEISDKERESQEEMLLQRLLDARAYHQQKQS